MIAATWAEVLALGCRLCRWSARTGTAGWVLTGRHPLCPVRHDEDEYWAGRFCGGDPR